MIDVQRYSVHHWNDKMEYSELSRRDKNTGAKNKMVSLSDTISGEDSLLQGSSINHSPVSFALKDETVSDSKLIEFATEIVADIIARAQAVHKDDEPQEKEEKIDPVVLDMVKKFVSDVLAQAQKQAITVRKNKNNQNMQIDDGNIEGNFSMQAQHWVSQFKRRAWYTRASRFFVNVFGRMCPCKTPEH